MTMLRSLTALAVLLTPVPALSATQIYSFSISGASQPLSPSNDRLFLSANSGSVLYDRFFGLQTTTFRPQDSGGLSGVFPSNVFQTVTLNGETQTLVYSVQTRVSGTGPQSGHSIQIGASPVLFSKSGVFLVPDAYSPPAAGVGLSQSGVIRAKLSSPTGSPPPKPKAALMDSASSALGGIAASLAVCLALTPCKAILLVEGATVEAVNGFAGYLGILSYITHKYAADPVDFNYKNVASPQAPVVASISGSGAISSTLKDVSLATGKAQSLTDAMIISYNRAEGAYFSNDPLYIAPQLEALDTYQEQLGNQFVAIGSGFDRLNGLLGAQAPAGLAENAAALTSAGLSLSTPAVPEPNSWVMLILGFVGIGVALRSSKRGDRPPRLAKSID